MYKSFGRKLMTAALLVIVLVGVALATPQGRAFAQEIMQLFTRADGRSLPMQPSNLVSQPAGAATAQPPSPLMTLAEAENQAGFKAAYFTALPSGLEFTGARLYGKTISLEYAVSGKDGSLMLLQSRQGFLQSDWDQVPASEIVPVSIDGINGEFVKGTFVVLPGEDSATWNSSAPILRLRWERDGAWYELTSFGESGLLAWLDKESMVSMAESLEYPAP